MLTQELVMVRIKVYFFIFNSVYTEDGISCLTAQNTSVLRTTVRGF